MPCFFPSVSSVKTNLMPVDYVELLDAAAHSLFLVSAYDILKCPVDQRPRFDAALVRSKKCGSVILLDSGNYEGFWKADLNWQPGEFHEVASATHHHLCFCYDNQDPRGDSLSIAQDVVASVLRDQEHALGTVVPIVHGAATLLPDAARIVAEELSPVLLAVPERALGDGIVKRIRTVRNIREALNALEVYCPLHLLGTGIPFRLLPTHWREPIASMDWNGVRPSSITTPDDCCIFSSGIYCAIRQSGARTMRFPTSSPS